MSAFIVTHAHINALVTWANEHITGNPDYCDPQRIGRILWDENRRSVAYRYKEPVSTPEPFEWRPFDAKPLTLAGVIKAVECLEYQSCETPDYDTREAARILRTIKGEAISRLPGYRNAEWCIAEPQTATAA